MAQLITQEFMDRLASAYDTRPTSNTYKLFDMVANRYAEHQETLDRIRDWRDIDQAEGTTLERIGLSVGQARLGLSDDEYRSLIKLKIRSNFSKGDIETLNEICRLLLGDGFEGIIEGNMINQYVPTIPNEEASLYFVLSGDNLPENIYTGEIARLTAGGVRSNFQVLYRPSIDIDVNYRGAERPPQQFIRAGQMRTSGATFTTGGRFY